MEKTSNIAYSLRTEIGFAFAIIGIQFGTAVRNVLPSLDLGYIFMAMSILCIIDYKNLFKGSFLNVFSPGVFSVLFFYFLTIIFLLFSTISQDNRFIDSYILEYNKLLRMSLYVIIFIFCLTTQRRKQFINFPRLLLYITAFINIVILYQVTKGFTGIYLENVFYNAIDNTNMMAEGGDKTTMGRALLLNIICCMVCKHQNKFEYIARIFLTISALWSLFMFNTRASIVCSFICYMTYLWRMHSINKTAFVTKRNILRAVFAIFLLLLLIISIPQLQEQLEHIYNNILSGIFGFMGLVPGGDVVYDDSANVRLQAMRNFTFFDEDNFLSFLWGHGVLRTFIDFPIIQCFYDMGMLGFIPYFIALILSPIYILKNYNSSEPSILILQLFSIQYFFDQFYAGLPYWSFQFMPILLLLFFYKNKYVQH